LHNSEQILDLKPLPDLQFPVLGSIGLFSMKPSFKLLSIPEILFLRKSVLTNEKIPQLEAWVEFLLRYLEINRPSIIKRARLQFGSSQVGRMALLELTALFMDTYFRWGDLRYLNLVLKIMDMPRIYSMSSIGKKITGQNKNLPFLLIQIRLMILRQAALDGITRI